MKTSLFPFSTSYAVVFTLAATSVAVATPGAWTATGSLGTARQMHAAALLADGSGRVLVAGGYVNGTNLNLAQLYDPTAGTWSATGTLNTARRLATLTALSSGRAVLAGGAGSNPTSPSLRSTEIYQASSGLWTMLPDMATARYGHTATLIDSLNMILVTGGYNDGTSLAGCELFDVSQAKWNTAGSLATERFYHTATLLATGKVLVVGGTNGTFIRASAELFDPATNLWTSAGGLDAARYSHTATRLADGRVLVVGGQTLTGSLASAELYNPATGLWSATGPLSVARHTHTATLLDDGRVLVAGGQNNITGSLSSAELYHPATGTWTTAGSLAAVRNQHAATRLDNGRVLVAGGFGGVTLDGCELYEPYSGLSALESWRLSYFGAPANSGNGADSNDYEKDGLANLIEFAFSLHPKQNSAGQLPRPQRAGSNFVVSFTQPAGVSGITYGAEWSATMQPGSWTNITDTGNAGASPPQHTFSVSTAARPELFMRLKVTSP